MALSPGQRLGPYEIVGRLGAGGMGEVYRARDPRLDRDVAIKVISSEFARDSTAMNRFEREATSIAKLSHPNVLAIYEFAHDQDPAFVVMELVDGETLRARLANGPIAPRRAVAYAQQMALGLAAAHARGIVHRDLKPENVMITRDDRIKILDFGLAKPVEASGTAETRGASRGTEVGTVLGTIAYMAPEQVRGLAVDQRADLFALGAVLYEVLSGQRAFAGATPADTMSAILQADPPELDVVGLQISPSLNRLVRRCLEKPIELRFQSANDLAFALETVATLSSTASGVSPSAVETLPRAAAWLPWTLAAVATVAAVAVWWTHRAPSPVQAWSHFTRITEAAGEETSPTLSPDGQTVLYAARANGRWGIFATRAGGRNVIPIVTDPDHDFRAPTISPDGSLIAFHESSSVKGGIFVAGVTGESVRRVTDTGFDPSWSPDGKSLAFATEEVQDNPAARLGDNSTIYLVAAAGGTPRKIVVDGDGVQPSWSPHGDRLVYWSNTAGQRDIYTVATSGGPRTPITQDAAIDWCPVWAPDGQSIYFSSDRGGEMNLWRISVDESTGRPTGAPEPVTASVQATAALPSLSRNGRKLAFRSEVSAINPTAIPFDPATLRAGTPVPLDTATNKREPTDVSADGRLIAYDAFTERQEDLFVGPARGGSLRRITDDVSRFLNRGPVFTRDAKSLIFSSNRDGGWALWAIDVDGGNLRRIGTCPGGAIFALLSPQGDEVILDSVGGGLYRMPLSGSATATRLPGTMHNHLSFAGEGWSPDGASLVGTMEDMSGRTAGVSVYDLQTHAISVISNDETYGVHWLKDSRRVVYFDQDGWQLVVLDTVTHARTVVDLTLPAPADPEPFAVSPDNRMIYYGAVRAEADIWLIERQ